jgi:lysophospholipid acyltransferase (LPLAT)-like uncharacterized protein
MPVAGRAARQEATIDNARPLPPPPAKAPRRSLLKRVRRRVRPFVVGPILRIAGAVVPYLYVGYLWLVWKTSRVEDHGYPSLAAEVIAKGDGLVAVLWHEEVFSVPWAYREMRPHTLANLSDSGEMIKKILERCGYVVFQGGSSRRKSRQREHVLVTMVRHMRSNPRVVYGLTVDGASGPYHVMKPGALLIAHKCRRPVVLVRTWAKRNLRLSTWDRMAIPLPFNHIRQYLRGPYSTPEDAGDPAVFEAFRQRLEQDLEQLAQESLDWSR